jgi:hypothetical protein
MVWATWVHHATEIFGHVDRRPSASHPILTGVAGAHDGAVRADGACFAALFLAARQYLARSAPVRDGDVSGRACGSTVGPGHSAPPSASAPPNQARVPRRCLKPRQRGRRLDCGRHQPGVNSQCRQGVSSGCRLTVCSGRWRSQWSAAPSGARRAAGRCLAREAPEVVNPHGLKSCAAHALTAADRCVPSSDGPPSGALLWSDRRLQGNEFEAVDVGCR